jgi:hypothetical protein
MTNKLLVTNSFIFILNMTVKQVVTLSFFYYSLLLCIHDVWMHIITLILKQVSYLDGNEFIFYYIKKVKVPL